MLAARDRRVFTGVEPAVVEHRSSEAVVECGSRSVSIFNEPDLAKQVKASREQEEKPEEQKGQKSAKPAPAAPALACTPGVSQACVGVAGCQGGQACLEDGSGFGPCQCAPASPPASDEKAAGEAATGEAAPDKTPASAPAVPTK